MSVKDNSFGIADLQDKMLDILKYFISVCEENNLKYWAGGGTCLGALRHEGFIPWDDDLDVFMPRPDYEKLWNIWNLNYTESKYKLCRTSNHKNYHHRVMQMVDLDTTFINCRNVNEDIEHGVYIDIIPMDACASSFYGRMKQILNAIIYSIYNIQCLPEFQGGKVMRFGINVLLFLIKDNDRRCKIWKKSEEKMTKNNWNSATKTVELTTSFKSLLRTWPKEWFLSTRKAKFEDIEINIPIGAEKYMKAIYGDYMSWPDISEQKVRHNTIFVDLDNCYLKYKGEYYCTNNI